MLDILNAKNKVDKGVYKKVHVNFGYPYLKQVLKDVNSHDEEYVVTFEENLSVGPIGNLETEIGQREREEWIRNNLEQIKEPPFSTKLKSTIDQLVSIPENIPIYIWVSENASEQTWIIFITYLLKNRKNNIYIVNTAQLYRELFKKKAKKYIPISSGEILMEELETIYKYTQEHQTYLSIEERKQIEIQWLKASASSTTLRIWENGEIKFVSEEYYDDFIIEKAKGIIGKKKGYILCLRLVGEVYGHIFQYIGDSFIEYRIRKLIGIGIFTYEGSLKEKHGYVIKFN